MKDQKIEIKSLFTDWHEVSEEQARRYVRHLLRSLPMIAKDKKTEWIEQNRLRGITVNELQI